MRSRPLILITASTQRRGVEFSDASLSLSYCYHQAIQAAGGLSWVLPIPLSAQEIDECVRRCDGVLLTGGDDVQPELYGARLRPQLRRTISAPDPQRDLLEFKLIDAVFRRHKPLLAICRGQQVLNVALGGSLLVDIATQTPGALNHSQPERKDELVHEVRLAPSSLLARIAGGAKLKVNSSHHQAVERVARLFRVSATSADGIVEGLELNPAHAMALPYLLGVQFHPERLWRQFPAFLDLFRSFTRACVKAGRLHG
jgi:putative glutamine amidotransferase